MEAVPTLTSSTYQAGDKHVLHLYLSVLCHSINWLWRYSDVMMGAMASQITSVSIVYSTVCSSADRRKHQSSASLAFVRGIHRGPVNSPHIWPTMIIATSAMIMAIAIEMIILINTMPSMNITFCLKDSAQCLFLCGICAWNAQLKFWKRWSLYSSKSPERHIRRAPCRGPLSRYVKLRVAHAPEFREPFSHHRL